MGFRLLYFSTKPKNPRRFMRWRTPFVSSLILCVFVSLMILDSDWVETIFIDHGIGCPCEGSSSTELPHNSATWGKLRAAASDLQLHRGSGWCFGIGMGTWVSRKVGKQYVFDEIKRRQVRNFKRHCTFLCDKLRGFFPDYKDQNGEFCLVSRHKDFRCIVLSRLKSWLKDRDSCMPTE